MSHLLIILLKLKKMKAESSVYILLSKLVNLHVSKIIIWISFALRLVGKTWNCFNKKRKVEVEK